MGVQGLTKFIINHAKPFRWSSTTTTVIVDGKSFLYHFLEGLDWRYGGENRTFMLRLSSFFQSVPQHVEFFMLIDGGNQDYKMTTLTKRRQERLAAIEDGLDSLPKSYHKIRKTIRTPWIMDVFIRLCNEHGAKVHFINGEADFALQSYAKEHDAYILSDDSDSFLLESKGVLRIGRNNSLQVIYSRNIFTALRLKTYDQLHTLGALLGNDVSKHIVDRALSAKIKSLSLDKGHYFHVLGGFIRSRGSLDACLRDLACSDNDAKIFRDAAALYSTNAERATSPFLALAETGECSEYLMHALQYKSLFYSILPEDYSRSCAMERCRELRELMYGDSNRSSDSEDSKGLDTHEYTEIYGGHEEKKLRVTGKVLDKPTLEGLCDALGLDIDTSKRVTLHDLVVEFVVKQMSSGSSESESETFQQWLRTGVPMMKEQSYKSNTHWFTLYQVAWSHMKTLSTLLHLDLDSGNHEIVNGSDMYCE